MNTLLPVGATGLHVYVWQLVVGFFIYWAIVAVIIDRIEKKSMFYPAFRWQIIAISWFIAPIALAYMAIEGIDKFSSGKDYKPDEQSDTKVMGSVFIVLYLGIHIVFMFIPPTVYHDDTKLVGPNGLTCYAEMAGDKKDIIRHYHCEGRAIASDNHSSQ